MYCKTVLTATFTVYQYAMKLRYLALCILVSWSAKAQRPSTRPANPPPVRLTATADSTQYALGAFIGLWIKDNGLAISNMTLFQRGLDDILQDRQRQIPDSLVGPRIEAYQQSMLKNKGIQQEKELFASLRDIPGVGMLPSGVRYIVFTNGNGPRPVQKDSIIIHLIAKLPDGTVVEDTYQAKKPFRATTSSFFPGLNEALQLMTEGSRWQLYVPAALAYGENGNGLIPSNSALVLEVELVSVLPSKT